MSSPPAPARRATLRRHPIVVAGFAALLLAGCGTGASPTPLPGSGGASEPAATVGPTAGPTASPLPARPTAPDASPAGSTPEPAAASLPAAPPVALLAGTAGGTAEGELGGFTWGDGGSDAPWIVVPASGAVEAGGPWTVTFSPPVTAASWRAAWAPIAGRTAGAIAGTAVGTGAVAFDVPAAGGPWTLRLEVDVATGRRAAWYWRIAAAP